MTKAWKQRWLTRRNMARFILVIFIGLVVGVLSPRWQKGSAPTNHVEIRQLAITACDPVRQSCPAIGDEGSVLIRFRGKVSALKPFQVEVRLRGRKASEVRNIILGFTMKGMDMGVNRYRLKRRQDGTWVAAVVLPVCTDRRNDWQVSLDVPMNNVIYRAAYEFRTQ